MNTKIYYSDKQLAEYLGIGRSTVWYYVKLHKLPKPIKINGSTRWNIDEVLKFIK